MKTSKYHMQSILSDHERTQKFLCKQQATYYSGKLSSGSRDWSLIFNPIDHQKVEDFALRGKAHRRVNRQACGLRHLRSRWWRRVWAVKSLRSGYCGNVTDSFDDYAGFEDDFLPLDGLPLKGFDVLGEKSIINPKPRHWRKRPKT